MCGRGGRWVGGAYVPIAQRTGPWLTIFPNSSAHFVTMVTSSWSARSALRLCVLRASPWAAQTRSSSALVATKRVNLTCVVFVSSILTIHPEVPVLTSPTALAAATPSAPRFPSSTCKRPRSLPSAWLAQTRREIPIVLLTMLSHPTSRAVSHCSSCFLTSTTCLVSPVRSRSSSRSWRAPSSRGMSACLQYLSVSDTSLQCRPFPCDPDHSLRPQQRRRPHCSK